MLYAESRSHIADRAKRGVSTPRAITATQHDAHDRKGGCAARRPTRMGARISTRGIAAPNMYPSPPVGSANRCLARAISRLARPCNAETAQNTQARWPARGAHPRAPQYRRCHALSGGCSSKLLAPLHGAAPLAPRIAAAQRSHTSPGPLASGAHRGSHHNRSTEPILRSHVAAAACAAKAVSLEAVRCSKPETTLCKYAIVGTSAESASRAARWRTGTRPGTPGRRRRGTHGGAVEFIEASKSSGQNTDAATSGACAATPRGGQGGASVKAGRSG